MRRVNVFWQLFLSYFVIILVPVLAASIMAYFYFVDKIQDEVEQSNVMVMKHFTRTTDEFLTILKNNMFNLVTATPVESFSYVTSTHRLEKNVEAIGRIREVLDQVQSVSTLQENIDSIYIYYHQTDSVMAQTGFHTADSFFNYYNHFEGLSIGQVRDLLSRSHMMSFQPFTVQEKGVLDKQVMSSRPVVAIMLSYPYRSPKPEWTLVVNIRKDRFEQQIAIREPEQRDTLILDDQGNIVAHSGNLNVTTLDLRNMLEGRSEGREKISIGDRQYLMNFVSSNFNNWKYATLTDIKEMNEPAQSIRMAAIGFFVLFFMVGIVLSYALSRRMYNPIHEIKRGLESFFGLRKDEKPGRQGNEFELIKQWSRDLISENKSMTQHINHVQPILHEYLIGKILTGEFNDELSVGISAKEIGLDFELKGIKAVCCIEFLYFKDARARMSQTDQSFLMAEIKNKLQKQRSGRIWFWQVRENVLACILSLPDSHYQTLVKQAELIKQELADYASLFRAIIGFGQVAEQIDQLPRSFREAQTVMDWKTSGKGHEILVRETGDLLETPLQESYLTDEEVRRLGNAVKAKDLKSLQLQFDELLEGLEPLLPMKDALRLGEDILNTIIRFYMADHPGDFDVKQYSAQLDRLKQCMTVEEIKQFFYELSTGMEPLEEKNGPSNAKFDELVAYIHEHYNEDLTLEYFASRLNMSLGHFSRSFKDYVGDKYVDYVAKLRIAKAKELLLTTHKTIDEIAVEIGYLSRNSFIKIFRKYEGTTPGKYRGIVNGGE